MKFGIITIFSHINNFNLYFGCLIGEPRGFKGHFNQIRHTVTNFSKMLSDKPVISDASAPGECRHSYANAMAILFALSFISFGALNKR